MRSNSLSITASVPATTANLGAGFDVFGAAVQLRNEVTFFPGREFSIQIYGEGSSSLTKSRDNLVYRSYEMAFRKIGREPVEGAFVIKNRIPISRGLGSSASASVLGAALAARIMGLGREDSFNIIEEVAIETEGHPDNVIPAIYGGVQLCYRDNAGFNHVRLKTPSKLELLLVIPSKKVSTSRARKILGNKLTYSEAVFNISRAALFVWALENKKYEFLKEATRDAIHQDKRMKLIPEASEVFRKLLNSEFCLAGWLSGSGSTMAFLVSKENSREFEEEAKTITMKKEFNSRILVTAFSETGLDVKE